MKIVNKERIVEVSKRKKSSKYIKRVKVKNKILVIELKRNNKLRIKNNDERIRLLKESLENLREALYNFINLASEKYDNYYFHSVVKVLEGINVYVDNELVLSLSIYNKLGFSVKRQLYYIKDFDIKVKYIINIKDRREKRKLDTAVKVLYALSIILKELYKEQKEIENLEKDINEILDVMMERLTWQT